MRSPFASSGWIGRQRPSVPSSTSRRITRFLVSMVVLEGSPGVMVMSLVLALWWDSQENNDSHFHDPKTGVELEVTDKQSLVEWIANNYKNFGAALEFVTNRCARGIINCSVVSN